MQAFIANDGPAPVELSAVTEITVGGATADELVRLVPKRELSLDQAFEFLREDEAVEVTPSFVRLRKETLAQVGRVKEQRRRTRGEAPANA